MNDPLEPCQKVLINHIQENIFNFHIHIYETQELWQVEWIPNCQFVAVTFLFNLGIEIWGKKALMEIACSLRNQRVCLIPGMLYKEWYLILEILFFKKKTGLYSLRCLWASTMTHLLNLSLFICRIGLNFPFYGKV
jgi:hypothetical protein